MLDVIFIGLSLSSILLLIAIGLSITYGAMGVINMAHGEMVMVGAYSTPLCGIYLGLGGSVMLAAIVGCAMCDDCQDYTSPVVNSVTESGPIYETISERSFTEESVVAEPVEASRASEAGSGTR